MDMLYVWIHREGDQREGEIEGTGRATESLSGAGGDVSRAGVEGLTLA